MTILILICAFLVGVVAVFFIISQPPLEPLDTDHNESEVQKNYHDL
jgi:hypothetical protein